MHSNTKTTSVIFLGILLSIVIFVIDLVTPLGVAGGVPYVAVIMITLWSARIRTTLYFAMLCSVLTLLGVFFSPQGGQIWQVLTNRFLALFAIWITAILSMQNRRGAEALTSVREFGRILEQSLNEIYVFDADSLQFLLVNRGARENLGYSMSELRKLTPLDLKPQLTPHLFAELIRPLRAGERPIINFETVHRRKDGSTYPVEVHLQPTSFEHAPAFLAVILDITRQRQADIDLQSGHEELQHIMASVPDYLWSAEIDEDGNFKYRYYSPVVQRITERPPEFFMEGPHKWLSTVHPDDQPRLASRLEQIKNDEADSLEEEYRVILPDNNTRWVRDSTKTVRLEDGSRRLFGVVSDVSASEERFQATFEQAAVGITHVAPDGRFLRVNQKLCDIWGYDREELQNCTFQDITHPDDLDEDLANVQRLLAGHITTYSMDKRYVCKDGSLGWGHLTVSLVRDEKGEPKYFISVVEDISDRKQAEAKLQRYADDLEVANRDLQGFAYITSHDLREPLRAVSGFCGLLQQQYQTLLDEKGKKFMQHIVEGASRMGDLLDGLLDYSRVGKRQAAFAQVDCNEALATALANLHAAIEESNAKIEHDKLPTIRCDEMQVVQLFQNLIANAIKYRGERDLQIRASAAKNGAGWQFSVQDNGIGFDPSQGERIYDIFQRLHTRDQYSGMGVGLAICKRIVQRHGGRIWAESEPGVGSTFYFTISEAGAAEQQ